MLLQNDGAHASRYRPSVRVDLVLLVAEKSQLRIILEQRRGGPFQGYQVLPGSPLKQGEAPNEAARRVLGRYVSQGSGYLEQLYCFGDSGRDPRGHVLSISYLALLSASQLNSLNDHCQLAFLAPSEVNGGSISRLQVNDSADLPQHLGFDHQAIIQQAHQHLKESISGSLLGYSLVPPEFTLRDLRHVHETVLAKALNKDNFRRKILATGRLEETGTQQEHVGHRPAKLYRLAHQTSL